MKKKYSREDFMLKMMEKRTIVTTNNRITEAKESTSNNIIEK